MPTEALSDFGCSRGVGLLPGKHAGQRASERSGSVYRSSSNFPDGLTDNPGGRLGFLPGGPPTPFLDLIDGRGPKDFGQKGQACKLVRPGESPMCRFGEKFRVPLTPGQHTLRVWSYQMLYNNKYRNSEPGDVSFIAEPGHKYVVECNVRNGEVSTLVVDLTDKANPRIANAPSTGPTTRP